MADTPCKNCPWRFGSTDRVIPGFDVEQAKALRRVCAPHSAKVMACHGSPEDNPTACHGFRQSDDAQNHQGLRRVTALGFADGPLPPVEGCFRTYDEMAAHHKWFDQTERDPMAIFWNRVAKEKSMEEQLREIIGRRRRKRKCRHL